MTMADSIAVMNEGHIEQLGSPTELYEHPSTAFVAGFLGVSNLLQGTVAGADAVRLDTGAEVRVPAARLAGRSGRVAVGVRPEKLRLDGEDVNRLSGFVAEVSYIGVSSQFIVKTDAGPVTVYVQNTGPGVRPAAEGNAVSLSWSPEATFVVEVPEGGPNHEQSHHTSPAARPRRRNRRRRPVARRASRRLRRRRDRGGRGAGRAGRARGAGGRAPGRGGARRRAAGRRAARPGAERHRLGELAAVPRHRRVGQQLSDPRGVRGRVRDRRRVPRRRHQRQRGVLRQDPPAARAGPGRRPRPRRPHRHLGSPRPHDRARLRREARQGGDPEHRQPARRPRQPGLRPEPRVHAAVGRAA